MVTRRAVLLVVLVLLAAVGVAAPPPAAADCDGPTIEYDAGEVARGETIHVVGSYFGDACHDTGPPPPSQGVLGVPLEDVEVVVLQGATEVVVGRGSADEDYNFVVDVPVPAQLQPGEARLTARGPEPFYL